MPRITNICNPAKLGHRDEPKAKKPPIRFKPLEEDIVLLCGKVCLTAKEVGQIVGLNDVGTVKDWLRDAGIIPVTVGKRDMYLVRDIARELEHSKIRAGV